MTARALVLCTAALLIAASAAANVLPIYIEDNHAGTFYWLAQNIDLDQPCTLVHFDAHSDASGIFDSDKIRAALRNVSSGQARQTLLDRWRSEGAVQCFNWIEPLMPAPIAKVIWVPAERLSPAEIRGRAQENREREAPAAQRRNAVDRIGSCRGKAERTGSASADPDARGVMGNVRGKKAWRAATEDRQ